MTPLEGTILRKRYQLLRLLGRGGMAEVYLARDMTRQTLVAIKILRADLADDPVFMRSFAAEARSLVRLRYPNIVQFFALERDREFAFIVMDYIDGETLRSEIAKRSTPLKFFETIHVLTGVAYALDYAHSQGLVHRDIKPGNIILARDGRVMLTDFGIAQVAESRSSDSPSLGTPAYMSPEQALDRPVTAQADIYSLGVTLFEMATRQRPFTGEEPGLTSTSTAHRVREAHVRLTPPDPRRFNAQLPEEAAQVILRAMAKAPERRWRTARQMADAWNRALQPVLDDDRTLGWLPVTSTSSSQTPSSPKPTPPKPAAEPEPQPVLNIEDKQSKEIWSPEPSRPDTELADRQRLAFGIMAAIIVLIILLAMFVLLGSY